MTLKELQELKIQQSFIKWFKSILLYNKYVANSNRYKSWDKIWAMYSDIVWLWQEEWFFSDWFDIADENIDSLIDAWVQLALWIAILWSWTLAIMWWRALFWIWERLLINSGRFSKLSKTWSFISKSLLLDWLTFYEGTNLMHNVIYNDIENIWDLFHWWNDLEWIGESILFMWMFHWVLKTFSLLKNMKPIESLKIKIPQEFLDKKFVQKSLELSGLWLTTWAILWISETIQYMKWEWFNPTFKWYIELLMLLVTFHKLSLIKK